MSDQPVVIPGQLTLSGSEVLDGFGAGAGTRGGPVPPLSAAYAQLLIEEHRRDDYQHARNVILETVRRRGTVHADDLAEEPFYQRNAIGVAFRSLERQRVIESTGEHRKSANPAAHGRRSYVYRLRAG